jgi:ABC-2 type transport system permease protein
VIAIGATSYGMLIGTLFNTQAQGAVFGAISVIILAALGGIWVPTFVMPDFMQQVSSFSPLNWGLEIYYGLFLRGQGLYQLWPYVLCYAAFILVNLIATSVYLKARSLV